jgi:toxin ParE1/3/4
VSRLRWSHRARRDLLAIGQYIAQDDPAIARRWVSRLRERARAAAVMPMSGRRVPELERDDIREVLVRGYRIVYRVREEEIHVLTVFEGHRLFPSSAILDEE